MTKGKESSCASEKTLDQLKTDSFIAMYHPAVDDSEPLNPEEDGSGFYNALSNSPEFNRFNESAINKAFSEKEVEKKGNMRTPTKQGIENEEQFSSSKKGTPRRKTTKTPGKLRFNVTEKQETSTPKRANTTKHTRSASTGQQYIQHSPPPSPRFNHPYQQLKGMGDTIDKDKQSATSSVINNTHNIDIDATTSFTNAGVESPPLNHVDKSVKVMTDSPSVDVGSPVTSFFKDALQQQPTATMLPKPATAIHSQNFPSVHSSINSSLVNKPSTIAGAYGFNQANEAPVSMATLQQGVGNVWGASPQKHAQDTKMNMAPDSEWTISPDLREKFATQFRDLKPENGFLYGTSVIVGNCCLVDTYEDILALKCFFFFTPAFALFLHFQTNASFEMLLFIHYVWLYYCINHSVRFHYCA